MYLNLVLIGLVFFSIALDLQAGGDSCIQPPSVTAYDFDIDDDNYLPLNYTVQNLYKTDTHIVSLG